MSDAGIETQLHLNGLRYSRLTGNKAGACSQSTSPSLERDRFHDIGMSKPQTKDPPGAHAVEELRTVGRENVFSLSSPFQKSRPHNTLRFGQERHHVGFQNPSGLIMDSLSLFGGEIIFFAEIGG